MLRVLSLALASSVAACAIHPVKQTPRLMIMSERQEIVLGQTASVAIEKHYGLVTGSTAEYVQRVGQRIAAIASGPSFYYRFALLDTHEVLAMALPGGFVYVSRGLLFLLSSEDQLAGVLAHEIAHVAVQHVAERAVIEVPLDLLTSAVGALVGLVSDDSAEQLRQSMLQMGIAPYSREQEREADRVGAALAASLGYDVLGLSVALERIEMAQQLVGASTRDAHHPPMGERVALLQTYAQVFERGPPNPLCNDDAFLGNLVGLLVGPSLHQARMQNDLLVWPDAKLAVPLPKHWTVEVTSSAVVAVAPDAKGFLTLMRLSQADAQSLFEKSWFVPAAPFVTQSGWPVARGRLRVGGEPSTYERLWWLSHNDEIYLWMGSWSAEQDGHWASQVDATVAQARVASDADLAGISYFQVTQAQGDETRGSRLGLGPPCLAAREAAR